MKKILALIKLFRTRLHYTRATSEIISFQLLIIGVLIAPLWRSQAAHWLMLSHRNTFSPKRQRQREFFLRFFGLYDSKIIDRIIPKTEHNDESIFAQRVITLKEPTGNEKGVILLKFLDTFTWLRANHDIERILKDYYIVFEMSYYGCCCAELLQYASYGATCVVGASYALEHDFLERLNSNLVPADFASCNWVDDRVFYPTKTEKKYDAVYVATWNPVKRHHILFEAVSRIADPSFRAVLVGSGYGGTRYEIEQWIRYYGVQDRVVVMEDLPHHAINQLLNESRCTVLLSLKEGGNKSIIEGMFANTPCIVLDDHISPAADFINEQTGRMVARQDLPSAMLWMRDNWQSFTPREWAMEHLHPRMTTATLETAVRHISEQEGRGWTTSLAVKYNRASMPQYYDESTPHPRPIDLQRFRRTAPLPDYSPHFTWPVWQLKKRLIRRLAFFFIDLVGLNALYRWRNKELIRVLAYHGVTSRKPPAPCWTVLSTQEFERQLAHVIRYYRCLATSEMISILAKQNGHTKDGVFITFDDGLVNSATEAEKILARHNLTACNFVCPGLSQRGELIWADSAWEGIVGSTVNQLDFQGIRGEIVPLPISKPNRARIATMIVEEMKGLSHNERQEWMNILESQHALSQDRDSIFALMTLADIKSMAERGRIDVASHSMNHPILATESQSQQEEEIVTCKKQLDDAAIPSFPFFAFPNGRPKVDYTRESVALVKNAGFAGAFSTIDGLFDTSGDKYQISRIAVGNDTSIWEFKARMSGFFYVLKRLLKRRKPPSL